jgi:hypothetical protein
MTLSEYGLVVCGGKFVLMEETSEAITCQEALPHQLNHILKVSLNTKNYRHIMQSQQINFY